MTAGNPLYMACGGQVDPDQLDALEATGDYAAEPKRDGIWSSVCRAAGPQAVLSRTGKPKPVALPPLPCDTALVGELSYGSEEATERRKALGHDFVDVFDIVQAGGRATGFMDDNDRRKRLEEFHTTLTEVQRQSFLLVPRWRSDFRAHFDAEPEGLVLKRVHGRADHPYSPAPNPWWLKVKHTLTVDMVVVGFELSDAEQYHGKRVAKNMVCGVWQAGKLVTMTKVGNFDLEMKRDLARRPTKYLGRVVELGCYRVFKSGALRHPSFVRFRDDKPAAACTWEALAALRRVGG